MNTVNIALLGCGTVGCGLVNVLADNQEIISRRLNQQIKVKACLVKDASKSRDCDTRDITLTTSVDDILNDPQIDIVVELMGGVSPADEYVKQALAKGKHIVTANKALLAEKGDALFECADNAKAMLAFEAAVGGGIPIIKILREALSGNRIQALSGILNGTSNFILSAMSDQGMSFEDALKQAQDLGYAEADPTFDVEGFDVAHKTRILAAIAFGLPLDAVQLTIEGISNITALDIQYAKTLGYRIKHLGVAETVNDALVCRVYPALVPAKHTLAHVNGAMNAVWVKSDALGESMYYGQGAGALPTASAVLADVIDVARLLPVEQSARVPFLGYQPQSLVSAQPVTSEQVQSAYYLRLQAKDKPGVLAEVTRLLGDNQISIEAIWQQERAENFGDVPIVIITHPSSEAQLQTATAKIAQLEDVQQHIQALRLFHQ
jgi:homoserine dehydrogenase